MLVFLIFMGLFGVFFVYLFPLVNLGVCFLEWSFLCFKLCLSWGGLLFSLVLLVVTLSVLLFSSYYLEGELSFGYYCFVLLVFVGSMFGLVFGAGGFTVLLCWDILGVSSFFLVLFYNNWDSCSGAMNTVLTNRLGDFFLFVFFSAVVFSGWYFFSVSVFVVVSGLFLLLAAFTKSAQFPFSNWLPKAMSAPTPVSSLVHSSTLVTAGLVLMMSFGELLLGLGLMEILLLVGLLTMVFSSVAALVEEDVKKVVALSTLSQMGFCVLSLGLGLSCVSLIHMVSHAFFKSCLFMQVGVLIHSSFGQQDGRNYSNLGSVSYGVQLQLLVTLFCLCGLLFSSGAVSKDFILELFYMGNFWFLLSLGFFLSVFLTFGYSYRLWKSFFFSFGKCVFFGAGSLLVNFLSLVLVVMSIFFVWWLSLNMLQVPGLYLYVDFFVPLLFLLLILVFAYFVLKVVFKELVYKFLVDYFSKGVVYFLVNFKFVDMLLGKLNDVGYTGLLMASSSFLLMLKNLYFNSLVLVLFFMFFLV
uniref:NADH:ubiquinone reductase (H(+)-translocating) n=1 Tax=Ascaridia sp. GHL-2013 TaxID=1316655 RepID=S4UE95_9BILA|nr:NADH dehydrogenase subunit 5 [Ascaridia sp. GHL-2013]